MPLCLLYQHMLVCSAQSPLYHPEFYSLFPRIHMTLYLFAVVLLPLSYLSFCSNLLSISLSSANKILLSLLNIILAISLLRLIYYQPFYCSSLDLDRLKDQLLSNLQVQRNLSYFFQLKVIQLLFLWGYRMFSPIYFSQQIQALAKLTFQQQAPQLK